ncbi:MAG: 50S ribosomal protein L18 [Planctomycetaceae bacterium]
MDKNKRVARRRLRRSQHVRNKVRGDADRPRLSINRSLKHFSCQLIDDLSGKTLASASTRDKSVRDNLSAAGNCDAAAKIGKLIAEKAAQAGVTMVRLDRGHTKYHGRVKAFAEAAREGGLQL